MTDRAGLQRVQDDPAANAPELTYQTQGLGINYSAVSLCAKEYAGKQLLILVAVANRVETLMHRSEQRRINQKSFTTKRSLSLWPPMRNQIA